jgi:hypothetical protein
MKRTILFASLAALGLASSATADTLLVNRGLPTANLNSAAGADRSNVSWADSEASANPSEYWVPGDDFTISGSGAYRVTDIRVWEVAAGINTPGFLPSGQTLLGGLNSGPIGTISSSYTSPSVTYADGTTYQGNNGGFWNIYQLDFSVNLTLNAGQTFDFFLNGPFTLGDNSGDYFNAFLHASNAGLSGSPQDGSDGTFLWLDVNTSLGAQTVETWNSQTGAGTSPFTPGGFPPSDGNVQVFGDPVPDASSTWMLLTGGLAALSLIRRKI